MTLTPAIKEALDRLSRATEANLLADASDINQMVRLANQEKDAQAHLLSVVAAEEGRKYEQLVKLHRELVEAIAEDEAEGLDPDMSPEALKRFVAASNRREAAYDALVAYRFPEAL